MAALPPHAPVTRPGPGAPRKRVLVVEYSQSGQLSAITRQIVAPLLENGRIDVHVEKLRPEADYPFPWPFFRFLDAFPESAHQVPPRLAPLGLTGDEDFDLVILPYQVWFLAPSLPIQGFLADPLAARLLAGKPVVTVVACRNMWLLAQEKMKARLAALGARLIDHVAFTDPGPTLATLVTTPRWMLTGRRDAWLGLPPAGIDAATIAGAARFGHALAEALDRDGEQGRGPLLAGLGAVTVDPRLLASEKVGTRSFFVWGKLLRWIGPPGAARRVPALAAYVAFLIAAIIAVVPLSLTVQTLLRPLLRRRLGALKTHFEQPSGSGRERLSPYEH